MAERVQPPRQLSPELFILQEPATDAEIKEALAFIDTPGSSWVTGGREAFRAWWAAYRATEHPMVMQYCLQSLLLAKSRGDNIEPASIACLQDRIKMLDGEHQIYGSQAAVVDDQFRTWPIIDPPRLDVRRLELGLEPYRMWRQQLIDLHYNPLRTTGIEWVDEALGLQE